MEPNGRDVSIMLVLGPQFDSHKLSICAAAWWAQIWENAKRLRAIVQLFEKVLVYGGKDENIDVTKHIGHTRSPRSIKSTSFGRLGPNAIGIWKRWGIPSKLGKVSRGFYPRKNQ